MKRYKVGDNYFWYNEGEQPSNAILVESKKIEPKKVNEAESNIEPADKVKAKVTIPKNKSKGVKAK